MSVKRYLVAGISMSSAALAQVPSPLKDGDLNTTKQVLEPGQKSVKPFWPGDGYGGRTTVAYDVKKGGKAINCRVITSSGIKRYDKLACDIILHPSRYSPDFSGYGVEPCVGVQQTIKWSSLYDHLGSSVDFPHGGF